MAILLLDRWLQPPPTTLSQHPPSPPDSFVLPATGTTNQSRTAKKYSITLQELEGGGSSGGCSLVPCESSVVVVVDGESNHPSNPLVFTPPTIGSLTRDEGRWRWRSKRPCLQRVATPLPLEVRWNNKMPQITYSKSMAPYLRRTKGWVGSGLLHHHPIPCKPGEKGAEGDRGRFRGRHFKQPHPHLQLLPLFFGSPSEI